MFVRAKKKSENKWQVMVVESTRQGKRVCQTIVRNIGLAHGLEELQKFRDIGEAAIVAINASRQPVLPGLDPNDVYKPARKRKPVDDQALVKNVFEDCRFTEGPEDIFGQVFDDSGFDSIIGSPLEAEKEWNEIFREVVLARISEPLSKLATSKLIETRFGKKIPVQKIYRMLDRLADSENQAKQAVAFRTHQILGGKVNVLLMSPHFTLKVLNKMSCAGLDSAKIASSKKLKLF
jgi:hypothetical protein